MSAPTATSSMCRMCLARSQQMIRSGVLGRKSLIVRRPNGQTRPGASAGKRPRPAPCPRDPIAVTEKVPPRTICLPAATRLPRRSRWPRTRRVAAPRTPSSVPGRTTGARPAFAPRRRCGPRPPGGPQARGARRFSVFARAGPCSWGCLLRGVASPSPLCDEFAAFAVCGWPRRPCAFVAMLLVRLRGYIGH